MNRSLALLALWAMAAGCAPAKPGEAVSIYTRNDAVQPFVLTIDPMPEPFFAMDVAGGGLCVRLAPHWTVFVNEGDVVAPGARGRERARIRSPAVNAGEVAIWVHVLADETVQTGFGVPAWWQGDLQKCT
jgi:hypothetical protein